MYSLAHLIYQINFLCPMNRRVERIYFHLIKDIIIHSHRSEHAIDKNKHITFEDFLFFHS